MKRLILPLLCLMLLSGCVLPVSNEYIYTVEHTDPFAYQQEPTKPTVPTKTVSGYYDLRSNFTRYIKEGVENAQIILTDYNRDVDEDIELIYEHLTENEPIVAYLAERIDLKHEKNNKGETVVSMHVVYRRDAKQTQSLQTVRGSKEAVEQCKSALEAFQTSYVLQISGYDGADITQELNRYCTENPMLFPEFPTIDILLFPKEGNIRVAEAHFDFSSSTQALREAKSALKASLASLNDYARSAESASEMFTKAVSYLKNRYTLIDEPDASVHGLLFNGVGNSRCFASLVCYLCGVHELGCETVHGTKDGESWDWCIVELDGQRRHLDLHEAVLKGVAFFTDDEMEGYEWNREQHEPCVISEPEETQPEES